MDPQVRLAERCEVTLSTDCVLACRPYGVYPNARSCLAIHNLAHQGSFEANKFHDVGLPGEWYGALEWQSPDDRQRRKTINILKVWRWSALTIVHWIILSL